MNDFSFISFNFFPSQKKTKKKVTKKLYTPKHKYIPCNTTAFHVIGQGNIIRPYLYGDEKKIRQIYIIQSWILGKLDGEKKIFFFLSKQEKNIRTSNCHLRKPRTPHKTLPVWIPIRISTLNPVASRTNLNIKKKQIYRLGKRNENGAYEQQHKKKCFVDEKKALSLYKFFFHSFQHSKIQKKNWNQKLISPEEKIEWEEMAFVATKKDKKSKPASVLY